ncbi:PREDICTED: organic cation/carnitine transporter 3 isoform X3 [Camelina sativa]|uniref:Organic cation/carnitine transporter 3 isoform X3 n=1 Tax=Camelina sativa TaxID=90675 RepID=A0ABM0WVG4_CAMSA|nr:PREDICTED: organic cation/carnitine transporter 3 isoform X3 [Camelina sativa]
MADSTRPFLSNSSESKLSPPRSLDETIEQCIGNFGWAQFLQAALISFAWFFDAQQTFITVFTDSQPTWHCTDSVCNTSSNLCTLPNQTWSWDFDPHVSIISEWGLQCAGSFFMGLPASSFFLGCLIGGLALSTLADSSLGRKNMLLLSCLIMSLSSMLTAFSTSIWVYAFLRFVNGFGRATIGTCALVLSTELVGKKWRGQVGAMGFFCFTLGFLTLPMFGYINKGNSWRYLYVWTSIPTLIYCSLVRIFVRESPRWLIVKGRKEEAVSILQSIASNAITVSSTNLSVSILQSIASNAITVSSTNLCFDVQENQSELNPDIYDALKILVRKSWLLKRLLVAMALGFGIGMVYYGMPLALTNLNFNLYLGVVFNALSEFPAFLITFFLIDKINRRDALIGFTALSGISSALIAALGQKLGSLQMVLELVSFFSACTAFNMTLIYTIELFPTCVRNSAMAMVRQALVFGGVFSPVMVAAGRENQFWSYGLFGLVIGLCGLFVVGLPETRGSVLCDTMDEEEYKTLARDNLLVDSVVLV